MSGNQQVIGTDRCSLQLQLRSNLGIVKRSFVGEIQNFDIGQECAQSRSVMLSPRRQFDPKPEFRVLITEQISSTACFCRRRKTTWFERFMM
jgi:hypothetical protein